MIVSDINWCDSTISPTTGCEGCELWNGRDVRICYAGQLHETRLAKSLPTLYAPKFQDVRLAPGRMKKAAGWSDLRGQERPDKPWLNGLPRLIFVGAMGDFASKSISFDYFKEEMIAAIDSKQGRRHMWLLLTKQPRRLAEWSADLGGLPDNCMAMTTVTTQATLWPRLSDLSLVKCKWRGVSAEPLLGPLDLSVGNYLGGMECYCGDFIVGEHGPLGTDACRMCQCQGARAPFLRQENQRLDWVIGGYVSGDEDPGHPDWIRTLRDQCVAAGVPFFFKQWGSWKPFCAMTQDENRALYRSNLKAPEEQDQDQYDAVYGRHCTVEHSAVNYLGQVGYDVAFYQLAEHPSRAGMQMFKVGKERAGRLLDGQEWSQVPAFAV